MPSPFPGMDLYLEGELWQEFHETLAGSIRALLMPLLAPTYVALLAKRYVLDRPALGVLDIPPSRAVYPSVHIDLVRQGARIPLAGTAPPAAYYVYLSRAQRRPFTKLWAMALPDTLPTAPLPLLPPDLDMPLDLQAAVDACFALVGYERLIGYTQSPPPPVLPPEDIAWVNATLRAAGLRAELVRLQLALLYRRHSVFSS